MCIRDSSNPSPGDNEHGVKQGLFGGLKKFGRKAKKFGRKVGRKIFGWGKRKRRRKLKGLRLKKLSTKKLRTKKLRFGKMKFRLGGKHKFHKHRMGSKMIKMGGKIIKLPVKSKKCLR